MQNDFLGYNMQQKKGVVEAFHELLSVVKPSRIIELGTGFGGLTVFFGLYGYCHECDVITYDNDPKDEAAINLIVFLGVERYILDLFSIAGQLSERIAEPGKTILICDNGNKVREVNTFAGALKSGDVIMAHDYYEFMTQDPSVLGRDTVCEISYDEIRDVCERYEVEKFMPETFSPELMWFCGQRK